MEIDYRAIAERMDNSKKLSDAYERELHPWEAGFDWEENERVRVRILHTKKTSRGKTSWEEYHTYPEYRWSRFSPLILFTKLLRYEVELRSGDIHGRNCPKCNTLRAMRTKGRVRIKRAARLAEDGPEEAGPVVVVL